MHRIQLVSMLVFCAALMANVHPVIAEEPVERFLTRLREASLYNLASVYLDNVSSNGLLPESIAADVPLEKLLLSQEGLPSLRSADDRQQRSIKLEQGYKEFLSKNPEHARRSEARIQLADLLLNRGQEALRKTSGKQPTDDDRKVARTSFEESRKIFEGTIEELRPILEKLQGNKADDAKKVALRERLKVEYRQAEILKGITSRFIGETFPTEAPDYKKWLEKSEAELTEVVKKTNSNEAGRHTLSLLYRGQVQMLLGKVDEAYDSLIRVAEIDEGGSFRDWKVQATTAIVRLQSKSPQPKFEPILAKADELLKSAQASERWTPDWIELQLAMAEGKLAWSTALESQPSGQNRAKAVKSEARAMLQNLAKRPGSHIEKTRQLLSSLGIEPVAKSEEKVLEVKKFSEGLTAARERFDRINTNNMSNEILRNRRKVVEPSEQASLDAEIETNEKASLADIKVAEGLLTKTIPLFSKEDSREDLARARYYLAFALLKREAFWECAALSDFVTRNGGELGLDAGKFALFAYGKLISKNGPEKSGSLIKARESLAAYMLETWPSAKESEDAALTLIEQALVEDRDEDVERYLGMLPKEGDRPSQTRRDVGVVLYHRYLIDQDKKRKANEAPTEKDKLALERAEAVLTAGWNGLNKGGLDQRAVECGNSLASIYMKSNRLAKAEELLQKKEIGPLVAIHSNLELEPRVKMETLRLLLQSMVLGAGSSGKKLEMKTVSEIVAEMKKEAAASPEGIGRLSNSLVQLSHDLQEQLNQVQNPAEKTKLAEGMQVLLEQLVQVSEEVNLLSWAGSTLNTLGLGMESSPTTQPQAAQLMKSAVLAFTKITELEARKPGTIQEAGQKMEDIQTRFAQALRGQGQYQAAIDKLEEVLASNPKSLLPQFEAAKTYQLWGQSAKSAEHYRKAIEGNKKSIWGWGILSKNLAKSPNLMDYFFEARYHLAESRYNAGLLETDPAKKNKAFEYSVGDLRSTAIQFPKVKESTWFKSMDQLMRNLQRDLNKPQIGMQEFFADPSKQPEKTP